jgi:hypothetical protein
MARSQFCDTQEPLSIGNSYNSFDNSSEKQGDKWFPIYHSMAVNVRLGNRVSPWPIESQVGTLPRPVA